jgi:predicted GTPase
LSDREHEDQVEELLERRDLVLVTAPGVVLGIGYAPLATAEI